MKKLFPMQQFQFHCQYILFNLINKPSNNFRTEQPNNQMLQKDELAQTGSQCYNKDSMQHEQYQYQVGQLRAKSVSSGVDNHRTQFIEHSISSYRFQLVPEHHYSDRVEKDEMESGDSVDEKVFSRKLEGAYVLQNVLSKMAAGLFISCWEEIKALRKVINTLQGRLEEGEQKDIWHDESIFNSNRVEKSPHQLHQQNTFRPLIQKHISQKKYQIMQRHQRGFTLDSLEKIKQNRSKSKQIQHLVPQNDFIETKSDQLNSLPVNSFSAAFYHKNHGYANNISMTQNNKVVNQIITTVKPIEQKLINNGEQDMQRLKIITQISDKLKFSTFRVQNTKIENPYDNQIMRRISRLQNTIKQLNVSNKNVEKKNYQPLNEVAPIIKTNNNVSNSPGQKVPISKLFTEISIIREEINQIKSISQRNVKEIPSNIIQSGNNFIPGKSHDYFANQKLQPQIIQYNNNKMQGVITPLNHFGVTFPQSKVEQKTDYSSDNKSSLMKSRIYRKVHTIQEPTLIYELQRKQVREQQVRIMVENVRKRRNERVKINQNDLQRALPIRGKYEEREWRQQRNDLKEQKNNCCALINY